MKLNLFIHFVRNHKPCLGKEVLLIVLHGINSLFQWSESIKLMMNYDDFLSTLSGIKYPRDEKIIWSYV